MVAAMLALMACQVLRQAPVLPARELFADIPFERGFLLTAARHPAPKVELGVLQTNAAPSPSPPTWRIAQWGTNFLLEPAVCASLGEGKWGIENPAKRIVVDRGVAESNTLLLEARAITEYSGKLRAFGEAWPHLLIEQRFEEAISLDKLSKLGFALEMRIPYCKAAPEFADKLNPGLHTAQVSAFWTLHNVSKDNPDYPDMIWFGIPLFDARYDIPPPNYALDAGKADASGKFICLLDGKRFWTGRTGDGQWRKLDVDLVSLIREALQITQQNGHLKNTRFEDLAITTFNLGWEVPGPYDAALEIRGLSMKAVAQ